MHPNNTKSNFFSKIIDKFKNFSEDEFFFEDLEEVMISNDINVNTALSIIDSLKVIIKKNNLKNDEIINILKEKIIDILKPLECIQSINKKSLNTYLFIGVNGSGKTTTVAKYAYFLRNKEFKVLVTAADTFRAAAIDQLLILGKNHEIPIFTNSKKDPSSVVFDSIVYAKKHQYDVLIIDTAGRLLTQNNLIEQLKKVKKTIIKMNPDGNNQTILTLDSNTGQNMVQQITKFDENLNLDGSILTKYDSSAKAGGILSLSDNKAIPIYFLGVGEKIEDLIHFNAKNFVSSLSLNEK